MAALARWQPDERSIVLIVATANVALFSLLSVAQWAAWSDATTSWDIEAGTTPLLLQAVAVFAIDAVYGTVILLSMLVVRAPKRSWPMRIVLISAFAGVLSIPRGMVLDMLESTPNDGSFDAAEWISGAAAASVAMCAALLTADLIAKMRSTERLRLEEQLNSQRVIDQLQEEELRIRRTVADNLHGTLQFRLVTVVAELDGMAAELDADAKTEHAGAIRKLAANVDEVREADIRSLSYSIFPAGVDIGTEQAIRVLLDRLPRTVSASVHVGPQLQRLSDDPSTTPPMALRLISVYTIEEAVSNALKHGKATSVRVFADAVPDGGPDRWQLDVIVDDNGTGFLNPSPEWHGLERHRIRIQSRGGSISLSNNEVGGCRLQFTLPWEARDARETSSQRHPPGLLDEHEGCRHSPVD